MNEGKHADAAIRVRTLAMVVAAGLFAALGPATARAQETGGSIFGWAPAGQTVTVRGVTSGTHRHATVKDNGHYAVGRLPLGIYTVTLEKDGKPVDTRSNIGLKVGRGAEVDFACPDDHCGKREEG
jgi:Carboxypeptidase regulatory-like domain